MNNEAGNYLYNGHGDVTKIVDVNGSNDILKTYDYVIWGDIISQTGNSAINDVFGKRGTK